MSLRFIMGMALLLYAGPLFGVIPRAKIIALLGEVSVKIRSDASVEKALRLQEISSGGELTTGPNSFVKLSLPDRTILQIGAESRIVLQEISPEQTILLTLEQGEARVKTKDTNLTRAKRLQMKTTAGTVIAGVAPQASSALPLRDYPRPQALLASLDNSLGLFAVVVDTLPAYPPRATSSNFTGDTRNDVEFIATSTLIANIGNGSVTISSRRGLNPLPTGFTLNRGSNEIWRTVTKIPADRLLVWQQNPTQTSERLPPLEAPQALPEAIAISRVALTSAEEIAELTEQVELLSPHSPAERIRDFSEISSIAQLKSGEDISTQVMQTTTEIHERVVSQQAARVVNGNSGSLIIGPRDITVGIRYE